MSGKNISVTFSGSGEPVSSAIACTPALVKILNRSRSCWSDGRAPTQPSKHWSEGLRLGRLRLTLMEDSPAP